MALDVNEVAFARLNPMERVAHTQKLIESHINACPSGLERNALTAANIILMEVQQGRRRG